MNILNKVDSKIHSKGGKENTQLCLTFQKSTVSASGIKSGDAVTITTLEGGLILIEKVAK